MLSFFNCACCKDDDRRERLMEQEGEAGKICTDAPPEIRGLPVLPVLGNEQKLQADFSEAKAAAHPEPSQAQKGKSDAKAKAKADAKNKAAEGAEAGETKASPKKAPAKPKAKDEAQIREEAAVLAKQGDEAFAKGNQDLAIDYYTQALGLDDKNITAWAGRGGVRFRKKLLRESLGDLDEALSLQPDHLLCLRDRAQVKLLLGDYSGAIADFDAKIRLAPADGKALMGRGEAKFSKGDKLAAVADFELAGRLGLPGAMDRAKKEKAKIQAGS